ncbi:MAG: PAS domain-containing protein [Myxococcales bacterium]|jgi:PAS domain S-box-containing protein
MDSNHEVLLRFFYLTSVGVVTLVSFWLRGSYRHHFFANWSWAYLCFSLTAVLDTATTVVECYPPIFVAAAASTSLIPYFFIRAGHEIGERRPGAWLIALPALLFALSLGLRLAHRIEVALTPPAVVIAVAFIWLGGVFFRKPLSRNRSLPQVLGLLMVLKGLWAIAYPVLAPQGSGWLGYWLDTVLHLLIGMAMLVFVLERSAEELHLLVESNANHSFFFANPRGEIVSWNSGAKRLHGFDEKDVVGKPFSNLGRDQQLLQTPKLATGTPTGCVEREGWFCRKDSSRFWARVIISPVLDHKQSLRGFAILVNDLSDRRLLEEERTRLAVAVRQSVEGVVIANGEGRIEYVNPAFERSRGMTAASLLGRPLQEIDLGGATDGLAEAIARKDGWYGRIAHREDGQHEIVEDLVLSPTYDASGAVDLFVLRIHDVSREIALQKQVHEARKMEEIGRLSGSIAHEFGNLLAIIVSYNHLLKKRAEDPLIAKSVEAIGRATGRADRLIRQLLAFCRQDVKVPQTIELNGFVSQLVSVVRRVVPETIALRADLDPAVDKIRVDPEQLEQALMNLVLNGRDAMPDGGTITLQTRAVTLNGDEEGWNQSPTAGKHFELIVSDEGCGMSPETRAKVFEPFFTTKPIGKGTGIGLSVVDTFVREAGGSIRLESELGRGTTFHLLFPASTIEATPKPTELPRPAQGAPITVLVVDDEPLLGQAVRRILEGHDFRTLGAKSPAEALELSQRHSGAIDLLLTDVSMPGMSGPTLAELLRGVYPGMKALFMSGLNDDPMTQHARSKGCSFINKPFEPEELLRMVSELVGGDSKRRDHEEGIGLS